MEFRNRRIEADGIIIAQLESQIEALLSSRMQYAEKEIQFLIDEISRFRANLDSHMGKMTYYRLMIHYKTERLSKCFSR